MLDRHLALMDAEQEEPNIAGLKLTERSYRDEKAIQQEMAWCHICNQNYFIDEVETHMNGDFHRRRVEQAKGKWQSWNDFHERQPWYDNYHARQRQQPWKDYNDRWNARSSSSSGRK